MHKIAIYYRVSTDRQDLESQKYAIGSWLNMQNPRPKVTEIEDWAFSGANRKRPGYKKLMELAQTRKIDTIVVYRLDRFSRDASSAIKTILELEELGVAFVSVSQPVLNLAHNMPFRRTIIAAFAEISELERDTLIARVKAGLEAARKRGVKLGAPVKLTTKAVERVLDLRKSGLSMKKIAKELHLSVGSVHSAILKAKKSGQIDT